MEILPEPDDIVIIMRSIEEAIAHGIRHFSVQGKELFTARDIVQAMLLDGKVQFKLPPGAIPSALNSNGRRSAD